MTLCEIGIFSSRPCMYSIVAREIFNTPIVVTCDTVRATVDDKNGKHGALEPSLLPTANVHEGPTRKTRR